MQHAAHPSQAAIIGSRSCFSTAFLRLTTVFQPRYRGNECSIGRSTPAHSCRLSNAGELLGHSSDTPSSTLSYVGECSLAVFSPFSLFSLVSRRQPAPRIGDEFLRVNRMAPRRWGKSSAEALNRVALVSYDSYLRPTAATLERSVPPPENMLFYEY